MRLRWAMANGINELECDRGDGNWVRVPLAPASVDIQPYHPPAPKRQRWEVEIKCGLDSVPVACSICSVGSTQIAAAKLAFWSTGEVAFADMTAQRLGADLRRYADYDHLPTFVRQAMREAALRLAGPPDEQ